MLVPKEGEIVREPNGTRVAVVDKVSDDTVYYRVVNNRGLLGAYRVTHKAWAKMVAKTK